MDKYIVKNLHSVPRSYVSDQNGQNIEFAPGEQKTVATRPPENQALWSYSVVEENSKPEDIENTSEIEGGDN